MSYLTCPSRIPRPRGAAGKGVVEEERLVDDEGVHDEHLQGPRCRAEAPDTRRGAGYRPD